VAAGFALYLNRRTALEGWDLEVQLRSLLQQGEPGGNTPAPVARSAAVLMLLSGIAVATSAIAPDGAHAQESEPSQVRQRIKDVLKDPVFGTYERRTRIESLHPTPRTEEQARDLKGFAAIVRAVAQVMRVAVWGALTIALLFAVYWLLRHVRFKGDAPPSPPPPPDLLFGLDVRPESLPKDIAAAAAAHIARGQLVAALSLLYRGALISLLHRDGVELSGGDTEADCMAKVKPRVNATTHLYLVRLVAAWQAAAYAQRTPPAAEVEALATQWQGIFGRAVPA
jgi:hypothetical protein